MAFDRSKEQGGKHITVVHKANIMKFTDGLFRDVFFEVAKELIQSNCSLRVRKNRSMHPFPSGWRT